MKKGRNALDKSLRQFRVAYSTLIQKKSLENLRNLLNVVLKAIAALFNLVQRPCKELCMLVYIVREYYWSGDTIFDYVSGIYGSEIMPEALEFYKSLQEVVLQNLSVNLPIPNSVLSIQRLTFNFLSLDGRAFEYLQVEFCFRTCNQRPHSPEYAVQKR